MSLPADAVPGYSLRERIGRGATGEVWRAVPDQHPGRLVAVKLLHDPRTPELGTLEREAEAMRALAHPNVLELLELVRLPQGAALVTPFAAGGSLADRIAAGTAPAGPPELADLGARLASALAAAHDAGLVHRDVKPANVLFDREERPMLADLGTAAVRGRTGAIVGTPEYLDPRLLDGRPPDAVSDLYGLGVTLYETAAGVPPYAGATPERTLDAARRGVHVPLGAHVDLPDRLAGLIETLFTPDPAQRPVSAAAVAARFDEYQHQLRAPGALPPPPGGGRAGVLGAQPTRDRPEVPARSDDAQPSPPPAPSEPGTGAAGPRGSGTIVWRPAPPDALDAFGEPTEPEPPRRARWPWFVGLALLAAIGGLTAVVLSGDGSDPDPTLQRLDGAADDLAEDGSSGSEEPGSGEARRPAPPCDPADDDVLAAAQDPARGGVAAVGDEALVFAADVDGRGCSVPLRWDGAELRVPREDGTTDRYALGAAPDDVLLVGDWTCDGRETPALYRPADGQVFTFDVLTTDGAEVAVSGTPSEVIDGTPQVRTGSDGCDTVVVEPGASPSP
ncbi:MAG: serine/threonine protein kinase [Nitriliruptoraceae bacterium]|nr:serine/threonine protein kinase [Nitriliruptoraceae bacterium]